MGRFWLDGALRLSVDGVPATLAASGARLVLSVEDPRGFLRRSGLASKTRSLIEAVTAAGLTLAVRRRGQDVILMGAGVNSGWVARLLGYPNLRVASLLQLLLSLASRPS